MSVHRAHHGGHAAQAAAEAQLAEEAQRAGQSTQGHGHSRSHRPGRHKGYVFRHASGARQGSTRTSKGPQPRRPPRPKLPKPAVMSENEDDDDFGLDQPIDNEDKWTGAPLQSHDNSGEEAADEARRAELRSKPFVNEDLSPAMSRSGRKDGKKGSARERPKPKRDSAPATLSLAGPPGLRLLLGKDAAAAPLEAKRQALAESLVWAALVAPPRILSTCGGAASAQMIATTAYIKQLEEPLEKRMKFADVKQLLVDACAAAKTVAVPPVDGQSESFRALVPLELLNAERPRTPGQRAEAVDRANLIRQTKDSASVKIRP